MKEEPTPEEEMTSEIISAEEPETEEPSGLSESEKQQAEQNMKQLYQYIIYILAGLIGVALLISIISSIVKHKHR